MSSALALFLLLPGAVGAFARPAVFADTSTPANTVTSYYNAIDRTEYLRAYSYLLVPGRPNFRQFATHWADATYVSLDAVKVLGYYSVSSMQASLCVGVRVHVVRHQGRPAHYGGYYVVVSTTGEEPDFGGWRIDLSVSHLMLLHRGQLVQDRCRIAAR